MEHGAFDEQMFNDFSSPLSPLGGKPLVSSVSNTNGVSHQLPSVMLSVGSGTCVASGAVVAGELCTQRLPDCNSILSSNTNGDNSSPKLDAYGQKMEYVNKMGCYSPTQKYEYHSTPPPTQQQQLTSPSASSANMPQQQHLSQFAQAHHAHQQQQNQQQYSPHSPPTATTPNSLMHQQQQQQLHHMHHHAHHQQQLHQAHHKHLSHQHSGLLTGNGVNGEYHHALNVNGKLEYEHHLQHMYAGSPHHHATHTDVTAMMDVNDAANGTLVTTTCNNGLINGGIVPSPSMTINGNNDAITAMSNGTNATATTSHSKHKKSDEINGDNNNNNINSTITSTITTTSLASSSSSSTTTSSSSSTTPTTTPTNTTSTTPTVKKDNKKKVIQMALKKRKHGMSLIICY